METPDTFTLLPIHLDATTKALSTPQNIPTLTAELTILNALHRTILSSDTTSSGVPPPPIPVNPKRSAQITKLRDAGNAAYKKSAFADAIRMYSLGIDMALGRPYWEPAGLVREEVSALYANRAQAHMALQQWLEGAVDAQCSVELKRVGNAKAWWRRGRCLVEMGRVEEAREWVGKGVEFEGGEKELGELEKEVEALVERRRVKG